MKYLTIFMCVLLFGEILGEDDLTATYARKMNASIENVTECIDRTEVTPEDLSRFQDRRNLLNVMDDQAEYRNYGCFLACILQKRGLMVGSNFSFDKINQKIDGAHDNLNVNSVLHKIAEMCSSTVENLEDECEAALTFAICMVKDMYNQRRGGN